MADSAEPENSQGPTEGTGPAVDPTHVFISYASSDTAVASALVEHLEQHGITCWIAPRDVDAGVLYADAIVRAISGARAFVLVLSKNSIDSSHVGREVERAASKRRPIFALRIDAAPLTPALEYFLSESQWLDAQPGQMQPAYAKLIVAIRKSVPGAPRIVPGATPGTSTTTASVVRRGSRNRIVLGTGLAVLLVAFAALLVDRSWVAKHATPEQAAIPAASAPAAARTFDAAIPEKSIAVLPFADMSEKKDQEYFSDGLTEELIDHLARMPGLHVPGRTSSFYFKGRSEDIATIAQRLRVANVLEGSVRLSGHAIRVSAHLIVANRGYDVWSQTYDRDLKDIFQVQDEIAGKVAQEMQVALQSGQSNARSEESNIAAYNLLLQGDFYRRRVNKDDIAKAIEFYKQAIRLDPDYAKAWANLAVAYAWQGGYAWVPLTEAAAHWREAAERAVKIDPSLADAHRILGFGRMMFDYDWGEPDGSLTWRGSWIPASKGRFDLLRYWRRTQVTSMSQSASSMKAWTETPWMQPV
jgi:TolB-like protein